MKVSTAPVYARVACEGKQRFSSAVLAHQVARQGNRRADRSYRAYRCVYCHGWHLGGGVFKTSAKGK
ncbi:hypothetical protein [Eleftheria terrae]|uniref:hypothetical protein n=1 Tax=Eleftheria terrae TaxID=1597781 RepID=UPI00263B0C29|nr:hypothetical protein [Eleftheria terrae]WKB52998.1 hypothetical protein N7L95_00925 [Eleftheria terrae]